MAMNGKCEQFVLEDFKTCAKVASMKRGRAEAIVAEVQHSVSKWWSFAGEVGVPEEVGQKIQRTLLLQLFK